MRQPGAALEGGHGPVCAGPQLQFQPQQLQTAEHVAPIPATREAWT